MARQSVILPALMLLISCTDDIVEEPMFVQPTAAAVLQPEYGGPFDEPVGFVANGLGGRISLLALKQGRYLTDDPTASFLRTNPLATGGARLLSSVAVYAPEASTVTVFAGDKFFGQLLEVPYIIGADDNGWPIEQTASIADPPSFEDIDGSGDSPTLDNLTVRTGYTTTEDWTVTYEEASAAWRVEGSRSGKQEQRAVPGTEYRGDARNVTFTIEGTATEGDTFRFRTENGLLEHDVGGRPLELALSPVGDRLAMVVHDTLLDRPVLRWFDPASRTLLGDTPLPEAARPTRLAWTPSGDRLFVSDLGTAAVWEIAGDTVTALPLPWPTLDVAPMIDEASGETQLFVVPQTARSIWVMNRETQTLTDLNPARPGLQGREFLGPVTGIAAMHAPFRFPETDSAGVHKFERAVAVSLATGRLVFMEEQSGCLVQSNLGPRTQLSSDFSFSEDFTTNFSAESGPTLEGNDINSRHVVVNSCGGIAKNETWTVRFDGIRQAWVVEGLISGLQEQLAYEDERYVSDGGEVSFTIRAGQTPSQDNWTIQFQVLEGIVSADGANNSDNLVDVALDLPGDPVYFHYRVGPDDGGWRPVDERPLILAVAQSGDLAARVEPNTGELEVIWE